MKKQKEQQEKHKLDNFKDHTHLWNIVPGGKGNGIAILQSIVDSILNNNYDHSNNMPTIILVGEEGVGKTFIARAIANSLAIEDIRECPGRYYENGYFSHQFFNDSSSDTLHLITDIQQLHEKAEANLWKYLNNRECTYYNSANRAYTNTVYCNGMVVLTAINKDKISESLIKAATHVIEIDPMNADQLEAALHQRLVFYGIDYDKEVLQAIIYHGSSQIRFVVRFLKHCLMIMNAVMADDCLTMDLVNKAIKLRPMTVPPASIDECIPF